MRAERFGSYSIATTRASTPSLFRFQSMTRYMRLWPPPRWRTVRRPRLLRPPDLLSGSRSERSGFLPLVSSSNVETDMPRRPGEVGLYSFSGMCLSLSASSHALEQLDPLAGRERHDSLLPDPRHAGLLPEAAHLAGYFDRVDGRDLDVEDILDRPLDLDLVGVLQHL